MITRLNEFPAVVPFFAEDVLEPSHSGPADIMDETHACLVAFDNTRGTAGGVRELMHCDFVLPLRHTESFLADLAQNPRADTAFQNGENSRMRNAAALHGEPHRENHPPRREKLHNILAHHPGCW